MLEKAWCSGSYQENIDMNNGNNGRHNGNFVATTSTSLCFVVSECFSVGHGTNIAVEGAGSNANVGGGVVIFT